MHHVKVYQFGPVEAFELGFALVGRPLITVYVYRVGNLLIDSGPRHLSRIVDRLAAQKALAAILLTHHHEDHSGNAGVLGRRHKVPIYAHPQAEHKLKDSFPILPYQHYLSGKAAKADITPYPESIVANSLRIRPIHTPGHSKDHTVFLEEHNGWLFSGDLFLNDRIHFFRSDEQIGQQIASLKKALGYDFDALFCGHRPHPEKGRRHLANKLDFLISFQDRVSRFLDLGLEEKEIIRRMQTRSDLKLRWFTFGNASFAHLVRSCIREAQWQVSGFGVQGSGDKLPPERGEP